MAGLATPAGAHPAGGGFNVASVFHTILGFRKVVEALEFSRTALQKHLEQMQELLVAQKVANVDVMRTEVRLSSVEQDLVEAENILAIQHRLPANLIGLPDPAPQLQVVGELARPPSPHRLADNLILALAKQVWEADALLCPCCQNEMRIAALIDQAEVIVCILCHLGLWEADVRVESARGPPDPAEPTIEPWLDDPFPDYDHEPVMAFSEN